MVKITAIDQSTIRKAKKSPSYFSEYFMNYKLHWYQEEMLDAVAKGYDVVICCSRQIGKSTAMAVAVVWWAVTRPKNNILIVSATLEQALEFYNKVMNFFRDNDILYEMVIKETLREMILTNGSRIFNKAVGQKGLTSRGTSIDLLVIDEADFVPDDVFISINATQASTDGQTILISTPNKKGTTFYNYFQDGMLARKEYEEGKRDRPIRTIEEGGTEFMAFHYDYTVGLDVYKPNGKPQLSKRIIQREKQTLPKYAFEQEYLAIWSEDVASYFSTSAILDNTKDYPMLQRGIKGRTYFMGVDFAKRQDRTVVIVVEKETEFNYRVVHIYWDDGRSYHTQRLKIEEIARNFNIQRAFMDRTGVGDSIIDEMNDNPDSPLYGKIEGFNLSIQEKVNLYGNLLRLFQSHLLTIPNYKPLIDELMYLQFEKSEISQYVKIHAPEGGHDDFPDALALACVFTRDLTIDDIAQAIVTVSALKRREEEKVRTHTPQTIDDLLFYDSDRYEVNRNNGNSFPLIGRNNKSSTNKRNYIEKGLKIRRRYI